MGESCLTKKQAQFLFRFHPVVDFGIYLGDRTLVALDAKIHYRVQRINLSTILLTQSVKS